MKKLKSISFILIILLVLPSLSGCRRGGTQPSPLPYQEYTTPIPEPLLDEPTEPTSQPLSDTAADDELILEIEFEDESNELPQDLYEQIDEAIDTETDRDISEVDIYNIRPLLMSNTNAVWHIFGTEIDSYDGGMRRSYHFDTGILVNTDDYAANGTEILSIWVGFNHADYRFHFDGISLMSTYTDVVNKFGGPGGIREEDGHGDAAFSYLYTPLDDGGWGGFTNGWVPEAVRFYFTENNILVGIQWFTPV